MTLAEWLDSTNKTPDWLARELARRGHKIRLRAVQRWTRGQSIPRSPYVIRAIEEVTGGAVMLADLLTTETPRRLGRRPKRPEPLSAGVPEFAS